MSAGLLILLLVVIVAVAAALWWFVGQSEAPPATVTPSTAGATPTEAAPAVTAGADDLSVGDLYKAARAAIEEKRLVTPPGNNALEYYLRILARQPDDSSATDALREMFPFATAPVEEQINQGNFDEAARIMGLLAKADPSNYTLTILRSKLDAKKKQNDRDQQQQAQQAAAAAARAAGAPQTAAAAAGTAAAGTPAATDATAATPAATPAATAAATPTREVARATPAPVAAPPPAPVEEPVGESRDVRVVTPPQPSYPSAAVRNRQNGWVEVEFTVAADGSVQNARVVNAQPARTFDREAISAIEAARFEPRLDKGRPVAATLRRRIEFKLNN
ncbi:MAG TPA: energy transducer TonB [Dokdonella sp.]